MSLPPNDYFNTPPTFQELALTLAIAKLITSLSSEELQNSSWFSAIVFAEQNPEGTPEMRQVLELEMQNLTTNAFFSMPKQDIQEALKKAGLSEFERARVLRAATKGES